ncbi:rhomboid family intramembrane serine protease [Candidatus Woesearchaeota archaeon]|nr:rhomboid family intramembrane serine protease [Candidatus Woesearchaeota archaeon]
MEHAGHRSGSFSAFSLRNAAFLLIVINAVMFILQQAVKGLTGSLMLVSGDVLVRPWIVVTSMFLHGGGTHLLFNMYALLLFGTLIEQRIGTKRFLLLYFISGILAGFGFAAFQEVVIGASGSAVGASGAIMGVLGMTIILLPDLRVLLFFFIPMSMRTAGVIFALVDLLGIFGIGIPGIANVAHLVGLAVGLGYGYFLLRKKKEFSARFARSPEQPRIRRMLVVKRSSSAPKGRESAGGTKSAAKDSRDVNKSIELSKEEMEDYLKYGRL